MRLFGEFLVVLSRLPPLGILRSRVPARPRVGQGSHSVISDQKFRATFRSKRVTVPAAITQNSPRMEEARTQPRWTPSSICGAHGHGGDRPPRQLETVCAGDHDRQVTSDAANCSLESCLMSERARCSQRNLGSPVDQGIAPATGEPVYSAF